MRKNLILICLVFQVVGVIANQTESKIKEVIVYQNGAKIVREAIVTVPAGTSDIVLSDLTSSLRQNTLQVDIEGNAILLSASSRQNYLQEKKYSATIKVLQDSLELIENQLKVLAGEKLVYSGEEKLININNKLGSQKTGMEVEELKKLAEFYRSRLLDISKKIFEIENKEHSLNQTKGKIQRQLNQLNATTKKPTCEIIISVSANNQTKIKVNVTYLTSNAGWYPVYDIRSESPDKPMKLIYKANVYQTTSYDWKDVTLSISTRNPEADQNRPVLYPWFIDFYQEHIQNNYYKSKAASVPAARLNIMQEAITETDVKEPERPEYIVTEKTGRMAAEYKIQNKQTIPSDGKEHLVAMKEYDVSASYTYHAVPKLSDGVFLLAKLTDFGKLNLLPGQANLFNEGMYVGQSSINPQTTADTLLVSLGRDEKISVKRNILQDFTKKQTIGNNIRESKGFEILVKNNKNIPVEVEILDQIPISKNKEIEVSLEEYDGAEYLKNYGKLLWKEKLKQGESKKLKFTFSVKYPKDRTISGI